ncbi:MAG TPA: hypothetical protein VGT05_03255 [Patescibacteria group bacterium]|nr:hypothetical protein [Patescibacteria group bacterium]
MQEQQPAEQGGMQPEPQLLSEHEKLIMQAQLAQISKHSRRFIVQQEGNQSPTLEQTITAIDQFPDLAATLTAKLTSNQVEYLACELELMAKLHLVEITDIPKDKGQIVQLYYNSLKKIQENELNQAPQQPQPGEVMVEEVPNNEPNAQPATPQTQPQNIDVKASEPIDQSGQNEGQDVTTNIQQSNSAHDSQQGLVPAELHATPRAGRSDEVQWGNPNVGLWAKYLEGSVAMIPPFDGTVAELIPMVQMLDFLQNNLQRYNPQPGGLGREEMRERIGDLLEAIWVNSENELANEIHSRFNEAHPDESIGLVTNDDLSYDTNVFLQAIGHVAQSGEGNAVIHIGPGVIRPNSPGPVVPPPEVSSQHGRVSPRQIPQGDTQAGYSVKPVGKKPSAAVNGLSYKERLRLEKEREERLDRDIRQEARIVLNLPSTLPPESIEDEISLDDFKDIYLRNLQAPPYSIEFYNRRIRPFVEELMQIVPTGLPNQTVSREQFDARVNSCLRAIYRHLPPEAIGQLPPSMRTGYNTYVTKDNSLLLRSLLNLH